MAVTLNASTSAGFIQTADTSGDISLQNNGTTALNLTSGNLQFNSGYGSVATAYGCRAWVNFDGTAASPITARASANISSITKASTSDYTINFTTAMPDINYSIVATTSPGSAYSSVGIAELNSARASTSIVAPTTSAFALSVVNAGSGVAASVSYVNVAVFR
jgi:hypothetical protein